MQTRRLAAGYTLIEIAVVVAIVGVITATAMYSYRPMAKANNSVSQLAEIARIEEALIAFAQRNHRLPCADDNGDGIEGNAGSCGASGYVTGGVPYVTLNIVPPADFGQGAAANLIYAVYRNGTTSPDADLASLVERNNDAVGDNNYQNTDDFMRALIEASNAAVSASYLNITGAGTINGASNCSSNTVANVAFALVSGGGDDMDKNNSIFDGAHNTVTWPGGNAIKCFAAPATPDSAVYDDKVRAMSFAALISAMQQ